MPAAWAAPTAGTAPAIPARESVRPIIVELHSWRECFPWLRECVPPRWRQLRSGGEPSRSGAERPGGHGEGSRPSGGVSPPDGRPSHPGWSCRHREGRSPVWKAMPSPCSGSSPLRRGTLPPIWGRGPSRWGASPSGRECLPSPRECVAPRSGPSPSGSRSLLARSARFLDDPEPLGACPALEDLRSGRFAKGKDGATRGWNRYRWARRRLQRSSEWEGKPWQT